MTEQELKRLASQKGISPTQAMHWMQRWEKARMPFRKIAAKGARAIVWDDEKGEIAKDVRVECYRVRDSHSVTIRSRRISDEQ